MKNKVKQWTDKILESILTEEFHVVKKRHIRKFDELMEQKALLT